MRPTTYRNRDMIETDVLIVGAGPAGLATAISIVREASRRGDKPPRVVVLDKGRSLGSHVLSGAIEAASLADSTASSRRKRSRSCRARRRW